METVHFFQLFYVYTYIGIEIDIFETASSKTIRGILLDTTTDAPARSAWLNIRQFNGYSGCQVCTEPGEQLDLGPGKKNARRQCHVYPFNAEYAQTTVHAKLREYAVVKQQALVAMSQISLKGKVAVSILVTLYVVQIQYMYFIVF